MLAASVELLSFILQGKLLYLSDVDWRLAFKKLTVQVTRTWCFPGTNIQVISSSYFLNAEDLVGYPDANPNAVAVSLEILNFAVDKFESSFPSAEGLVLGATVP
jgi:hypothetical protein